MKCLNKEKKKLDKWERQMTSRRRRRRVTGSGQRSHIASSCHSHLHLYYCIDHHPFPAAAIMPAAIRMDVSTLVLGMFLSGCANSLLSVHLPSLTRLAVGSR
jgi:hypothetical protein